MSVDLVQATPDDALEAAALFATSWPAMSRIHHETDLDPFEAQLQLQEAEGDAARHTFFIRKQAETIGFVDLLEDTDKDHTTTAGLFTMREDCLDLRGEAWTAVSTFARSREVVD